MTQNKEKSPLTKIRELRRLSQRELAEMIAPPEKLTSVTQTISYLERGKRKWREDWLENISEALQCSKLQLLGEEPVETLMDSNDPRRLRVVAKNEYPIKDQYIRYAMEIVDDLVDAEELTKEGRVEVVSEIYKEIYDFFENNHSKEEYDKFIKAIETKNAVNKGLLNFFAKHKNELV